MQPKINKKQLKIGGTQPVEVIQFRHERRKIMNLSDNLKKIRKDNNLSQEELAEKLGVSRQSVSKWESGSAYPEMDKVLQICKMFDLNIDELLNQNIKEVERNKQSKLNVNKYIDDFLSYFSKTINMFSSMRFKDKIKCIFEQIFIIVLIYIVSVILGSILSSIFGNLFSFLNSKVYYTIYSILKGVYRFAILIVTIIVVLHIFKTRYLDYYEIVNKEPEEEKNDIEKDVKETIEDKKEDKKIIVDKRERVIIRDEKHSEYSFINGLLKCLLFLFKVFVVVVFGIPFCCSLVSFAIALGLSFIIIKSGILFFGVFLATLSLIFLNIIVLYFIFNFVTSRKSNTSLIFRTIIISLLLGGCGIGLAFVSLKDFRIINEPDEEYTIHKEVTFDMKKDLSLEEDIYYDRFEYIEEKRKDIKIEYTYAKYCDINFIEKYNNIYYTRDCNSSNNQIVKYVTDNLNDKVFVDPDFLEVKIYASKENIKKLQESNNKRCINQGIIDRDERIRELENTVNELENEINNIEIEEDFED